MERPLKNIFKRRQFKSFDIYQYQKGYYNDIIKQKEKFFNYILNKDHHQKGKNKFNVDFQNFRRNSKISKSFIDFESTKPKFRRENSFNFR